MHFSLIALVTPLLFAARLVAYLPSLTQLRKPILLLTEIYVTHFSAIAGHNCKCQDANGQYNDKTEFCCFNQGPALNAYHGDQVHQVNLALPFVLFLSL